MRTSSCCFNRVNTVFSDSVIMSTCCYRYTYSTSFPSWWTRESSQVHLIAVGLDHHSRYIIQGSFYQSRYIVQLIAVKQTDTQASAYAHTHTHTHKQRQFLKECLKIYCTYCARDFFRNVDKKHVKDLEFVKHVFNYIVRVWCLYLFPPKQIFFLNDDVATL